MKACISDITGLVVNLPDEILENVSNYLLLSIRKFQGSYDEVEFKLRERLFGYYLSQGQFSEAGKILAGINCESTSFVLNDIQKADTYLRAAGS